MLRSISAFVLGVIVCGSLSGCVVYDERRCRHGWEPAHRDFRGRWHRGHCI